jgi:sporulation protein YlmC with PRC-barrel domain
LAPVQDFAYLRPSEFRAADPDWDVGVENVFLLPYYGYGGLGPEPMDYEGNIAVRYDRVPKGEVEIQRASTVVSADGTRLGHVDGFLVDDQDDHITHVVLERGHLWGKREVTIPIGAVKSVKTESVALNLTKDEVGALESVQVRR